MWINKGHELDEKWISLGIINEKPLETYIWGAGENGKALLHNINKYCNISAFVDKNSALHGQCVNGIDVISPDSFVFKENRIVVIATAERFFNEISLQLDKKGFVKNMNYFFIKDFLNYFFPIISVYYYDRVFVSLCQICVTEKCTLKCIKCAHGCSSVKASDARELSLNEIYQSADVFFSKIDFVANFSLLGGEPLVYRNLTATIEYIGRHYRDKIDRFYITTNGTVVPEEELLDVCKKYDVSFLISNYTKQVPRLSEQLEKLKYKLELYGIKYDVIDEDGLWLDFGFDYVNNTVDEAKRIFSGCKTDCREIRKERLYYCVMARSSAENMGLIDEDTEGLDLSNIDSDQYKKIITEYMLGYSEKGYLEMCIHCNGMNNNRKYIEAGIQKD